MNTEEKIESPFTDLVVGDMSKMLRTYQQIAHFDVTQASRGVRRIEVWKRNEPEVGCSVFLAVNKKLNDDLELLTDAQGDGLYCDGQRIFAARDFSLNKYLPLNTPELRKNAREYVRRKLATMVAAADEVAA